MLEVDALMLRKPVAKEVDDAIAAIPAPTEADLLAQALAMPKIKRLVDASAVLQDIENIDANGGGEVVWVEFCAALAALKGGAA